MIFRGLEIWILLSGLLYAIFSTVYRLRSQREGEELKIGIGTFNLAKGIGIFLVVLIHSGLSVLTDADLLSGSFIVGVLFVFFHLRINACLLYNRGLW